MAQVLEVVEFVVQEQRPHLEYGKTQYDHVVLHDSQKGIRHCHVEVPESLLDQRQVWKYH